MKTKTVQDSQITLRKIRIFNYLQEEQEEHIDKNGKKHLTYILKVIGKVLKVNLKLLLNRVLILLLLK